jgi:hypothetical protein
MTKRLQFKRYSSAVANTIIGADGELIIDTTMRTIAVHDGHTPGGTKLATVNYIVDVTNANTQFKAYNQANTATVLAQAASNTANTGVVLAQAAFNYANTGSPQIQI